MAKFEGITEINESATYGIKIIAQNLDGAGTIILSGKELKTLVKLITLCSA